MMFYKEINFLFQIVAIHYPSPFAPTEPDKLPLAKSSITITGFEGINKDLATPSFNPMPSDHDLRI